MTQNQWIDAFAMKLGELGMNANAEFLVEMGRELYPRLGHLDPIEAAWAEFDEEPPHAE